MNQSLNALALSLEQKTLDLIQAGRWAELGAMISPECQFATRGGTLDKAQAMALMQGMQLQRATIRNLRATESGDALIVSFELACAELINAQPQSKVFSPRLSVWQKSGDGYVCIAYSDFNQA